MRIRIQVSLDILGCVYVRLFYTQYKKKRNTYIFADNLSNFKDVHFKLAGYIDEYVYH